MESVPELKLLVEERRGAQGNCARGSAQMPCSIASAVSGHSGPPFSKLDSQADGKMLPEVE